MESIKLTKKQKNKLLEMCKALFPLDYFSFNNDQEEDGIIDRNFASNYMPKSMKRLYWDDEGSHFHWFEFCMTHLVNVIFYPNMTNINRNTRDKVKYFFFQSFINSTEGGTAGYEHPIDYLYEQFKKL